MIAQEIVDSLTRHFSAYHAEPFRIQASSLLSGGSVNRVYRLKTTHGDFCLKVNDSGQFPGMFEAEARGLHVLAGAGEVRVPEPLFHDTGNHYTFLLLEYIEAARPVSDMMHRFGRSLARLHRHHAEQFGLEFNNYMGALPQSNRFHVKWSDFFIAERLDPQVKLATDRGYDLVRPFEALYSRLEGMFPEEPPSLIHGDLWNGNYLVSEDGTAALIDPAVSYGHREADIAMTSLFGGFGHDFYGGYDEEFPLAQGWRTRLDLYNLYPLLVHLNLFGSSYLGEIMTILKRS